MFETITNNFSGNIVVNFSSTKPKMTLAVAAKDLSGKIAIVTGAKYYEVGDFSSGIGLETARWLVANGCFVVMGMLNSVVPPFLKTYIL